MVLANIQILIIFVNCVISNVLIVQHRLHFVQDVILHKIEYWLVVIVFVIVLALMMTVCRLFAMCVIIHAISVMEIPMLIVVHVIQII